MHLESGAAPVWGGLWFLLPNRALNAQGSDTTDGDSSNKRGQRFSPMGAAGWGLFCEDQWPFDPSAGSGRAELRTGCGEEVCEGIRLYLPIIVKFLPNDFEIFYVL